PNRTPVPGEVGHLEIRALHGAGCVRPVRALPCERIHNGGIVDAFSVIDSRYRALYDRAVEVLGADPRVLAFEPGGSIATGEVDQWSDLDLHIAVGKDDFDAFVADWPQWLNTITATVFARTPIFPSIINT